MRIANDLMPNLDIFVAVHSRKMIHNSLLNVKVNSIICQMAKFR